MEKVRREQLQERENLGRLLWRAYGADAAIEDRISTGFAHFSRQYGDMRPHRHEREWIYVLDAKNATAHYGASFGAMNTSAALTPGDFLRFEQDECHLFTFGSEDGYLDILWFFELPMNHTTEQALR